MRRIALDQQTATCWVRTFSAGVDLRTAAGRLGHAGSGTTTLRVYAAWVSASDRRAAEILGSRMKRPR
jgi:integrase